MTEPCPIYPEGCHDPRHCVLGSPCVQQEESLGARLASFGLSASIKVYSRRSEEMNEQGRVRMDQITDLVSRWRASDACNDLSGRQLMRLATIATHRSTPREWGPGDTIPTDVATVESIGGLFWVRDPDPAAQAWTTDSLISDEEMVSTLGPVREISTPEMDLVTSPGRDADQRKAESEQEALTALVELAEESPS